jgi:integrase
MKEPEPVQVEISRLYARGLSWPVSGFSFAKLRSKPHTHATYLIRMRSTVKWAGTPLGFRLFSVWSSYIVLDAQLQMRHADIATTLPIYTHAIPKIQRDAMEGVTLQSVGQTNRVLKFAAK